ASTLKNRQLPRVIRNVILGWLVGGSLVFAIDLFRFATGRVGQRRAIVLPRVKRIFRRGLSVRLHALMGWVCIGTIDLEGVLPFASPCAGRAYANDIISGR